MFVLVCFYKTLHVLCIVELKEKDTGMGEVNKARTVVISADAGFEIAAVMRLILVLCKFVPRPK